MNNTETINDPKAQVRTWQHATIANADKVVCERAHFPSCLIQPTVHIYRHVRSLVLKKGATATIWPGGSIGTVRMAPGTHVHNMGEGRIARIIVGKKDRKSLTISQASYWSGGGTLIDLPPTSRGKVVYNPKAMKNEFGVIKETKVS